MDVGRTGVENWKLYYTAANQLFKNVKTTRFWVPKYKSKSSRTMKQANKRSHPACETRLPDGSRELLK